MRNVYLVCYDITSSKRLQKIHKKIQAFAIGGQKSFYECLMSKSELVDLRNWLYLEMDLIEDRIHIFQLDHRQKPQYFGISQQNSFKPFFIL